MAYAAVAGLAASAYTGEQNRKAGSQARTQAKKEADAQAQATEQATNKANAKLPDIAAIAAANQRLATGGAGSTLLTGPQGVDPQKLLLGKTTLLGG